MNVLKAIETTKTFFNVSDSLKNRTIEVLNNLPKALSDIVDLNVNVKTNDTIGVFWGAKELKVAYDNYWEVGYYAELLVTEMEPLKLNISFLDHVKNLGGYLEYTFEEDEIPSEIVSELITRTLNRVKYLVDISLLKYCKVTAGLLDSIHEESRIDRLDMIALKLVAETSYTLGRKPIDITYYGYGDLSDPSNFKIFTLTWETVAGTLLLSLMGDGLVDIQLTNAKETKEFKASINEIDQLVLRLLSNT